MLKIQKSFTKVVLDSSSFLIFRWIHCCLKISLWGATDLQHCHWTLKCMFFSFFFSGCACTRHISIGIQRLFACHFLHWISCDVKNHQSCPALRACGWQWLTSVVKQLNQQLGELKNCSNILVLVLCVPVSQDPLRNLNLWKEQKVGPLHFRLMYIET